VFASMAGTTTAPPPSVPGQVTGLTAGNPTASTVALTWTAPTSGSGIIGYTIQYRVTGTTSWSGFATGITATSASVSGLAAGTAYDFQVYAVNAGGSGPPSSVANATTTSASGNVTSITWNLTPAGPYTHGVGSIGVNAHVTPATSAVQFGFSTSATVPPTSWVEATYVNSDLWGAYVSTPASPGTWYAWVEGSDGSQPTVYPTSFTVT
jgi:Fibronectin type III domain